MAPLHPLGITLLLAFILGAIAGMRSFLPLAALGLTLWAHPIVDPHVAPATWLVHAAVAIILVLLALGELLGDKLPSTPNRTALAPFVFRLITGGLAGAALAETARQSVWAGVVVAVIAAAIFTVVMFRLRQRVDRATGVKDVYVGAGEDVLAIVLAVITMAVLIPG